MLGYSAVPRAVQLPTFNLKLDPVSRGGLPTFPVNLLIQAKRPSSMIRVPPSFRGQLATPHFRIEFDARQHRTLHRLQKRLSTRAVVTYASPVFCDWASLHQSIHAGSLVQLSTFPTLRRLSTPSGVTTGPAALVVPTAHLSSLRNPICSRRLHKQKNVWCSNNGLGLGRPDFGLGYCDVRSS